MPSTGNTPRHRWPSDEYSTPRIGEWSSLTSNEITVRPETTRTLVTAMDGGVLSTSNAALSSSPVSAVASGLDGASERSEEHTSELQSPCNIVCRLLLE